MKKLIGRVVVKNSFFKYGLSISYRITGIKLSIKKGEEVLGVYRVKELRLSNTSIIWISINNKEQR